MFEVTSETDVKVYSDDVCSQNMSFCEGESVIIMLKKNRTLTMHHNKRQNKLDRNFKEVH